MTVRLGELGGLSAEFAIKRERFSTFTAADLLLLPCGSGGQSASISQPTTVITRDFQLPPCTGKSVVCLFGGLPDRLCRALENRRFPEGCRIHGGKRRRYAGVVISVAAEGKGISPAEALVSLSPCVTQADCFPSHTRNCGNRLRRPLCRVFPSLPVPKRQAAEQRLSVWNITASACTERRCSRMETGLFPPSSTPTVRRTIAKQI